jgi:hypothetical protein
VFRIPDLRGKILFTLLIIGLYRIGAFVPAPGIDLDAVEELKRQAETGGGVVGFLQLFSGGALTQFAIFALGIMPYITASIIMQILTVVIPKLEEWQQMGAVGPFISEPEHDWCYFYTKAELARQKQDWEGVNRLLAEATSLGYQPSDPIEWLPFIEAQAMTGNLPAAGKLSREAFASDRRIRNGLCQVWKRVGANPDSQVDSAPIEQTLSEYRCAP